MEVSLLKLSLFWLIFVFSFICVILFVIRLFRFLILMFVLIGDLFMIMVVVSVVVFLF